MNWPDETEERWQIFRSSVDRASQGLYALVYDRKFTADSLLRRLQDTYKQSGMALIELKPPKGELAQEISTNLETLHKDV